MIIAAGGGLRHVVRIADVEYALEAMKHAEFARHPFGMAARAVRKDKLAARQRVDGGRELGVLAHWRQIDVVYVIEERLRVHAMHMHEAAQGGAELPIVCLLQVARVSKGYAQEAGDELAHALIDLQEQVAVGGIEGVVEVEHPHGRSLEPAPMCPLRR